MRRNSKSPEEAKALGEGLRQNRERLRLVLEDIQKATGVNVGQLSRFERGEFRMISKNLQKVQSFLQSQTGKGSGEDLVVRFTNLVAKSPRHEAAASAIVTALEALV